MPRLHGFRGGRDVGLILRGSNSVGAILVGLESPADAHDVLLSLDLTMGGNSEILVMLIVFPRCHPDVVQLSRSSSFDFCC